jgi:hypothetical protein
MKISTTFYLEQPPEEVARVLRSEEYKLAEEREREEHVSSVYRVLEQTDERLVFEVATVEYERTMTGALNRSKTFTSTNTNIWDAGNRTLRWTYRGQLGDRSSFSGLFRFLENGGGTRLTHEITIEVFVPVVGGVIARAVARSFEKSFPEFERLLRRHLARSGE